MLQIQQDIKFHHCPYLLILNFLQYSQLIIHYVYQERQKIILPDPLLRYLQKIFMKTFLRIHDLLFCCYMGLLNDIHPDFKNPLLLFYLSHYSQKSLLVFPLQKMMILFHNFNINWIPINQ